MATKIEWARNADGTKGETWNPTRGCSRVSPGCDHCFAMRQARRMDHPGGAYEGLTKYRSHLHRYKAGEPAMPGVDWSGKVRFVEERLGLPLRWRKPRMVFVDSMSDLFHPQVTDEQIAAVFGVMAGCPQHTFQVLTKRPGRMAGWFRWYEGTLGAGATPVAALYEASDRIGVDSPGDWARARADVTSWPLPNVWLGVTAENQAAADERIPLLLQVPAAVRFVSVEPMLGPVDLSRYMWPVCSSWQGDYASANEAKAAGAPVTRQQQSLVTAGRLFVNWVIAGCESGPGARPADVSWFRSLRDQCVEAGVSYFLKQMTIDGRLVKMPPLDGQVWDQLPQPEQEQTR